ncbi:hypothetical protein ACLB1N_34245 [Escherichia coli]
MNELNCGRGVIGFLYDGKVSEVVEEMDARIEELKDIIADKDAQDPGTGSQPEAIGTKAAPDAGKAKDTKSPKAGVTGTNKEFKKPVRFKADTVLDYLKANAPLHGVNHAGLIKEIWPIGAPGRNTFLGLLKTTQRRWPDNHHAARTRRNGYSCERITKTRHQTEPVSQPLLISLMIFSGYTYMKKWYNHNLFCKHKFIEWSD